MKISTAKICSVGELAKNYIWVFDIAVFPRAYHPTYLKSEDLILRCTTSKLPVITQKTTTVNVQETTIHDLEYADFGTQIQMQFIDYVDNKIAKFFSGWQTVLFDPETGIQTPKENAVAIITLSRLDKARNALCKYSMINAGPISFDEGSLQGNEGNYQPSVTFQYDFFRRDYYI